jgi:hypothetical protein
MGRREELAMREWQEIISREHIREHIRVARPELPWVYASKEPPTRKGLHHPAQPRVSSAIILKG